MSNKESADLFSCVMDTIRPGTHLEQDGATRARLAAVDHLVQDRFGATTFQELSRGQREMLLNEISSSVGTELGNLVQSLATRAAIDAYKTRTTWAPMGFRPLPDNVQWPALTQPTAPPTIPLSTTRDQYDVIIVGAGAGGGVAAHVLTQAGLNVLLVDRGSALSTHDLPLDHARNARGFTGLERQVDPPLAGNPRFIDDQLVLPNEFLWNNNAMTVGGGTRVYGAQAWRFNAEDFAMGTTYGDGFPDWPISYSDLEPYYDLAEWNVGVAGTGLVHRFDSPRSREYPMEALPGTTMDRYLARGAEKLGLPIGPVPLLINTTARDNRPACVRCGTCAGFACHADAKNGTHNTVILKAINTGRCHLASQTTALRLESHGTTIRGVQLKSHGQTKTITARHVVLAAGAIETARLLLISGVGNEHVGRYLQGHIYSGAVGLFDDVVQDSIGPGCSTATAQYRHHNDSVLGGGILANEFVPNPVEAWLKLTNAGLVPKIGKDGASIMNDVYPRAAFIVGPTQELPAASSRIQLHPTVTDNNNMPAAVLHADPLPPNDDLTAKFLSARAEEWLQESGAVETRQLDWRHRRGPSANQHQAGTCRMGSTPGNSATDQWGNLWGWQGVTVADASLHVTNGGVNPVLTTLALAWRCADHLSETMSH